MKNFIKHKVLWVSSYDVSFGDFMTNNLVMNSVMNYFDYEAQIHFMLPDTVLERISWYVHEQGVCDKVFVHPLHTKFEQGKFRALGPDYYDYVIIDHCGDIIKDVLEYFTPKAFLSMHPQCIQLDKRISNVYETLFGHWDGRRVSIDKYDNYRLYDKIKSLVADRNYMVVYPFSTRDLASINMTGLIKINEFAKRQNCSLLLCGENHAPYLFKNRMSHHMKTVVSEWNDSNVVNMLGVAIPKLQTVVQNANCVFYAPTGAAVLGIVKVFTNPSSYILSGGDSTIMWDIHNYFTNGSPVVKNVRTSCEYYPCGAITGNVPEKVMTCRVNKEAACLNAELELP